MKNPPPTPVVMATIERPWKKSLVWGLVALASSVGLAAAGGSAPDGPAVVSLLFVLSTAFTGPLFCFALLQYWFERRLRAAVAAGVIEVRPDHPAWTECAIVPTDDRPEPAPPAARAQDSLSHGGASSRP